MTSQTVGFVTVRFVTVGVVTGLLVTADVGPNEVGGQTNSRPSNRPSLRQFSMKEKNAIGPWG